MAADRDFDDIAREFRRDGACVVRGLLDEDEVARLREGVDENLAVPSERALEGGGDAAAFNMLTLHATSPSFPELGGVLGGGDALDHPLFPRLWPAA